MTEANVDTRDVVHQLVDELGEDRLSEAATALRELVQRSDSPRRQFRFAAGMSAEPDLAARSGDIVRDELGGGPRVILVDAGPLVALANDQDDAHAPEFAAPDFVAVSDVD